MAMAATKEEHYHEKVPSLSKDSMAEVKMGEEGFNEAFFTSKNPNKSNSKQKDKILVPSTESADISSLPPPPAADQTYEQHDVVDAFRRGGWWKGVVSKVSVLEGKREYNVVFENPFEQLHFSSEVLRSHLIWTDGKWVRPLKQEIPDIADCDEQSAHVDSTTSYSNAKKLNLLEQSKRIRLEHSSSPVATSRSKKPNKPATEIEETLSNNSKKFKNENHVTSLSAEESRAASMLLNSTQQVTDSALAKCSMRSLGENLALNKVGAAGAKEGFLENISQPPAMNVQLGSGLVKNQEMPFTKSSSHWQYVDSLEVFRSLPQKPHFSPLLGHEEATREGLAMGHMLNFATVVEKASKLSIEKPRSVFDSYLESLADLEKHGFNVKEVVDCINELLSFKRRQEQFDSRSKEFDRKIAECDCEKAKLEEDINAIDEMISKLKEQRAMKELEKMNEESKIDYLQYSALTIEDNIKFVKEKFKVKTAALRRYL